MTFDLPEDHRRAICAVLEKHPAVLEAILFGSRALGRSHDRSDIDIALCGPLNALAVERITLELEELPLAVHVDVQALDEIRHAGLRDHIDRVGVHFWRRNEASPPPRP